MIPKIICHIMSSVDGRVDNSRWSGTFDGTPQSKLTKIYAEIAESLHTDAWMFGLNTARDFLPGRYECQRREATEPRTPYHAPRRSRRLFVFADTEAATRFDSTTVRGDDIVVILGYDAPDEYLRYLRESGVSYLFGGADGMDLRKAATTLAEEFDIKSISLQGGGMINGAMLEAGLLEELSLVLYPGIDGLSGIKSIFEYTAGKTDSPARGQSLELLSVAQKEYGVVHLRYRFHHAAVNKYKDEKQIQN